MAETYLDRSQRLVAELRPYVPGITLDAAARRARVSPARIAKLSSNENPLGASPKAMATIRRLARAAHGYPSPTADELRAAIGRYLRVSPAQVVTGGGSSTLMHAIVAAFTAPGGKVVSLDPSFTVYSEIAVIHGCTPVTAPLRPDDFLLDVDTLRARHHPAHAARLPDPSQQPHLDAHPPRGLRGGCRPGGGGGCAHRLGRGLPRVRRRRGRLGGPADPGGGAAPVPRDGNAHLLEGVRPGQPPARLRGGDGRDGAPPRPGQRQVGNRPDRPGGRRGRPRRQGAPRPDAPGGPGSRAFLARAFAGLGFGVAPNPQGNYIMVDVSALGWTAPEFAEAVFRTGQVVIRGDFSDRHVRISIGRPAQNRRLVRVARQLAKGRRP